MYRFEDFAEPGEQIFLKESLYKQGELSHDHDFAEITYIKDGSGVCFENGEAVNVRAGDFLLTSLSDTHRFEPESRDFSWINCCFRPAFLFPELTGQHSGAELVRFLDPECTFKHISIRVGGADKLLKLMLEEYRQKAPGYQEVLRAELTALLLKYVNANRLQPRERRPEISREALMALVASYYTGGVVEPNVPAETVAQQIHVSTKYFSTFFKRKVGMTFCEFKKKLRIEQAAVQLRSTDANIGVIMGYCGYSSSKLFYKDFKRRYGMTPAQFRRSAVNISHESFLTNIAGWTKLPDIWRLTDDGFQAFDTGQPVFAVGSTCINDSRPFTYTVSARFDGNSFGLLFGVKEYFSAAQLQKCFSGMFIVPEKQEVQVTVCDETLGSRLLLDHEKTAGLVHELELKYAPETGTAAFALNKIQICRLQLAPEAITGNLGIAAFSAECTVKSAIITLVPNKQKAVNQAFLES